MDEAVNRYKLSTDYARLYELICAGNVIAGWVDYTENGEAKYGIRDIVQIRRLGNGISIGYRGRGYGFYNWEWQENGLSEADLLARICEIYNLAFIDPEVTP